MKSNDVTSQETAESEKIIDLKHEEAIDQQNSFTSPEIAQPKINQIQRRPGDGKRLRRRIIITDLIAALISFFAASTITSIFRDRSLISVAELIVESIVFAVVVFLLSSALQLYRTRIAFVPSDERLRILLVALAAGAFASVIDSIPATYVSFIFAASTTIVYFLSDTLFRAMFRNWLKVQRAQGRYQREVLLIGTNSDALAMYNLLRTHRDVGYSIVGVIGDRNQASNFTDVPWVGESQDTLEAVEKFSATGVIVSSNAMDPYELRKLTNHLLANSVHVHVSAGMFGFDDRRLRQQNFSREPVFYIEPISFPIFQRALKRGFDIIGAIIGMFLAAPVIAVAAIAIKLEDRGPVLFRQDRVGKNQTVFKCVKLRTMSVDAESKLDELRKDNERHGPLFKQSDDPRRTRVGKFLEATSLDELPQLCLVLKGVMSIVGPRPAMPQEVELFDQELNLRHLVRPGITGLWQVESRDNASFDAYRRLDIFYVENWSFMLDVSILTSTFHVVLARAIKTISGLHRPGWLRSGVESPGGAHGS